MSEFYRNMILDISKRKNERSNAKASPKKEAFFVSKIILRNIMPPFFVISYYGLKINPPFCL